MPDRSERTVGAGASAEREYERRRQLRRDRARERFGILGAVAVRARAEPDSIRAWKQGAGGEIQTARQLERQLRGRDVVLLHDRRIPERGRANIDHLAIGPAGVIVIDTKSARGRLQLTRAGGVLSPRHDVLLVNGRERTHLLDGIERQVAIVAAALARLDAVDVPVGGALCYPFIDGLPRLGRLRARDGLITISDAHGVAKLARRRGPIAAARATAIARLLAGRFPAA